MTENNATAYPPSVQKVLDAADVVGISVQMRHFESPGKTAAQAAELLECPLGAIVKSLIFQMKETGEMLLVLVSGENKADLDLLAKIFGQPVQPASPADILAWSGFKVGAVPPFGFDEDIPVLMDVDLMDYDRVWASGGSDFDLMGLTPSALWAASGADVMAIKAA
ncbi:YbaK/EbsC family protein [bacterium]|nr:YbaK/EbsC family protein [bacterium]